MAHPNFVNKILLTANEYRGNNQIWLTTSEKPKIKLKNH